MGYPAERFAPSQHNTAAAEDLLPLRLPAILQPADSSQITAISSSATLTPVESVEAVREDTDTSPAPLVYQGVL